MDVAAWVPSDIDLLRPNAARVYDYYLGGSHNFAVDREMADYAIERWPQVPTIIQANRSFLGRAVRFLVRAGVRQFLDLGSGIPTVGNVHEVAQAVAPDARVTYVDIDPVAVRHARLLLADNPGATVIQADLRDPDQVLTDPAVRDLLDFSQPIGLLMVAVLHFIPDSDDPWAIMARYRRSLVTGSHLVLSHATHDVEQHDRAIEHRDLYARTDTPMTMRSREEINGLLVGWELIEPGLVRLPLWRPEPDEELPTRPETFAGYVAVGRRL